MLITKLNDQIVRWRKPRYRNHTIRLFRSSFISDLDMLVGWKALTKFMILSIVVTINGHQFYDCACLEVKLCILGRIRNG